MEERGRVNGGKVGCVTLRPRSHVPVFDWPVADRTDESTTWNF